MQRELTLTNQIVIFVVEAVGVGMSIAAFVGWWVATP